MTALLAAAFAAGMVSTVNPCGFAMLPAYLGFFLSHPPGAGRPPVVAVTVAVSSGFLLVFTTAGVLLAIGIRAVVGIVPWLALAVGVALLVVGLAQLRGRRLLPYLAGPARVSHEGSFKGMLGFGVSYAVASLSCTLPIFLSLVGGAVAARTFTEAVLTFMAYGSGMALVVAGITVLVAAGRRALIDRIRPLGRRIDRLAGWVMTLAGVFIVWYWATVLSAGATALGSSPLVRWVDEISARMTGLLGRNVIAAAAAIIAILVVGYIWERRRQKSEPAEGTRPSQREHPTPSNQRRDPS